MDDSRTFSFVDLPSELISELIVLLEFNIVLVFKLRAINKAHNESFDIKKLLKLYNGHRSLTVRTEKALYALERKRLGLEYAKQLAKRLTWQQIRNQLETDVPDLPPAFLSLSDKSVGRSLIYTAIRAKNRSFLDSEFLLANLDAYKDELTAYPTVPLLRHAIEPNEIEYLKYLLSTPLFKSLPTTAYMLEDILSAYALNQREIKHEIISQLVNLVKPEDLMKYSNWIHKVTHTKFSHQIITAIFAYMTPPVQILYKAKIQNCPNCLYSALCSDSFADLLPYWDYGELPTQPAYYINRPISQKGLEWLSENVITQNGKIYGIEVIKGDPQTESRVLMMSIKHALCNTIHLELFEKLADLGLQLGLDSEGWRFITMNDPHRSKRGIYGIIEVVWKRFPRIIRWLFGKLLVWKMDAPELHFYIEFIIGICPAIVNDVYGNDMDVTILHAFASNLKYMKHDPNDVISVIDDIVKTRGVDINALDKEGNAFYDYFNQIWYSNVPRENAILLAALVDRGLLFLSKSGCTGSPYSWFTPDYRFNSNTSTIEMHGPHRNFAQKYCKILEIPFEFFDEEVVEVRLDINVLVRPMHVSFRDERHIFIEVLPGEYYYRWIINFYSVVDPNVSVVINNEADPMILLRILSFIIRLFIHFTHVVGKTIFKTSLPLNKADLLINCYSDFYLTGNFAPVHDEREKEDVRLVHGEIPKDMNGMFVRNGPNPQFTPEYYHWFAGDGMLHGVHFKSGEATYTNKFIKTLKYLSEKKAGKEIHMNLGAMASDPTFFYKMLFRMIKSKGKMDRSAINTANTALIYHGKRFLALNEAASPFQVDAGTLDSIGTYDFDGKLTHNVTAHPKVDPVTGEMVFFCYPVGPGPVTVKYSVATKDGDIPTTLDIDCGPVSKMMHDFAITSIIMDLPFLIDPKRTILGENPFNFDSSMPSRFGVFPRHSKNASEIKWFQTRSCYIVHTANAWEEGDEVVLVACRSDSISALGLSDNSEGNHTYMFEFRFNMKTGSMTEKKIFDIECEFPVINESLIGRKNRFVWAAVFPSDRAQDGRAIGLAKKDLQTGESRFVKHPYNAFGGEFVFVPRNGAVEEDDGYMTGFVHDESTDTSYLLVLSARDLSQVAHVKMPRRVPYGFHGRWVTQEQIQQQILSK